MPEQAPAVPVAPIGALPLCASDALAEAGTAVVFDVLL